MRGVKNRKIELNGLDIYPAYLLEDVLLYAPFEFWEEIEVHQLGSKLSVARGRIKFLPSAELLEVVQSEYPSKILKPLAPNQILDSLELVDLQPEPYKYSFRILNSGVFPEILFEAYIDLTKPDKDDVINNLKEKWDTKKIFLGGLSFVFDSIVLETSFKFQAANKEIQKELEKEIGSNGELLKCLKATKKAWEDNSKDWLKYDSSFPPESKFLEEGAEYFLSFALREFFIAKESSFNFDSLQPNAIYSVRSHLELSQETEIVFNKSKNEDLVINTIN